MLFTVKAIRIITPDTIISDDFMISALFFRRSNTAEQRFSIQIHGRSDRHLIKQNALN